MDGNLQRYISYQDMPTRKIFNTGQSQNIGVGIRCTTGQLLHDHLLFRHSGAPSSRFGRAVVHKRGVMGSRPDHTQQQIGTIILNRATEDLLINRNRGRPLDTA